MVVENLNKYNAVPTKCFDFRCVKTGVIYADNLILRKQEHVMQPEGNDRIKKNGTIKAAS